MTYVVSAGNDAIDFKTKTPAAYDEVLTATAMSDTDGVPGGLGEPENRCIAKDPGSGSADDVFAPFSNFATLSSDRAHTVAAPRGVRSLYLQ